MFRNFTKREFIQTFIQSIAMVLMGYIALLTAMLFFQ